jgi:uncharacterized protein YraI
MRWRFLLAIAAAAACSGVNASAEPRAVVDPANLRSGPGLAWPIIGVVPADTPVEILTCAQGNTTGWCKVSYGDAVGYVAASVLAPRGSSGVMVAPLATSYSVRIYSAPSRGAAVLGVIPPETVVDSSGCRKRAFRDWCRVTYNDVNGYVRRSLLNRSNAVLGND